MPLIYSGTIPVNLAFQFLLFSNLIIQPPWAFCSISQAHAQQCQMTCDLLPSSMKIRPKYSIITGITIHQADTMSWQLP